MLSEVVEDLQGLEFAIVASARQEKCLSGTLSPSFGTESFQPCPDSE